MHDCRPRPDGDACGRLASQIKATLHPRIYRSRADAGGGASPWQYRM
jgi:hypothetical protein